MADKIPAGLETLFETERESIRSSLSALVLAIHWSVVRAGLRIRSNSGTDDANKTYSEKLPSGWSLALGSDDTTVFMQHYHDPSDDSTTYQLKVIQIVKDKTAVATITKQKGLSAAGASSSSDSADSQTAASTFEIRNFIRLTPDKEPKTYSVQEVFIKAHELEQQIWTDLMEPVGLKVLGLPPFQGPYSDKSKQQEEEQRQSTNRAPLYNDPLSVGAGRHPSHYHPRAPTPSMPNVRPGGIGPIFDPIGGYGRSDLDPLGRFGGGMLADPRGFRNPIIRPGRLPPGAVPPGARFDPFGPPNPNPGAGNPNWAVPNPDEPPPPGFDDMFM